MAPAPAPERRARNIMRMQSSDEALAIATPISQCARVRARSRSQPFLVHLLATALIMNRSFWFSKITPCRVYREKLKREREARE